MRRTVSTGALALALIAAGSATSSGIAGAHARTAPTAVGRIVLVTNNQVVESVTVESNGATTHRKVIGPVTTPLPGTTTQVNALTSSSDGKWIAWEEDAVRNGKYGLVFKRSVVVLRNTSTGHVSTIDNKDLDGLLGFAGDTLVARSSHQTRVDVLDRHPKLHVVGFKESQYATATTTYARGIVETNLVDRGSSKLHEQLRLNSFNHHVRTLHTYVISGQDTHEPSNMWASGDGKHVAVELGDHTDFGGVGDSSRIDEYSTAAGHATRHQLGGYGAKRTRWRAQQSAFAGPHDALWTAWSALPSSGTGGVRTAVAYYSGGHWRLAAKGAIAVAANHAGWVAVQPGKYVAVADAPSPQFTLVTTANMSLFHGHHRVSTLDVAGNELAWIR